MQKEDSLYSDARSLVVGVGQTSIGLGWEVDRYNAFSIDRAGRSHT